MSGTSVAAGPQPRRWELEMKFHLGDTVGTYYRLSPSRRSTGYMVVGANNRQPWTSVSSGKRSGHCSALCLVKACNNY